MEAVAMAEVIYWERSRRRIRDRRRRPCLTPAAPRCSCSRTTISSRTRLAEVRSSVTRYRVTRVEARVEAILPPPARPLPGYLLLVLEDREITCVRNFQPCE